MSSRVRTRKPTAMKAFDHDKPANREEWVFAFVEEHRN